MRRLHTALGASLIVAVACADSTPASESPPSTPPITGSVGVEANVCRDGCTLDLKRTCVDGAPAAACDEPLGCSHGLCVSPCAAAGAHQSTAGCSFYTAVPDTTSMHGACFAVALANTWSVPAKVAIEYEGIGVDVRRVLRAPRGRGRDVTYEALASPEIAPGEIAIAFLADGGSGPGACPAAIGGAGLERDVAVHGPGVGTAFHIRSSAPVTAHAFYPFAGASTGIGAATALFPVPSWDKSAIAVELNLPHGAGPLLQVVSAETNTAISLVPVDAIHGGGPVLASSPAGQKLTLRPGSGEFVQFSQQTQFSLTGTFFEATGPIALFAGSACADSGVAACDPLFQQIPPLTHLGNEYVAVRPRNRFAEKDESTPWHLVGLADGTELEYEPSAPEGAPRQLRAGQIAQFRSSQPFVVRSQDERHPFYAAAMMESCRVYGTDDDCRGDPDVVTITPTSRFGQRAAFFTDPSYPETNLVIVRAISGTVVPDVELDCVPKVEGWEPVGPRFEFARVDLSRGDFEAQGQCNNGAHVIRSAGAITATVWGWGSPATRKAGGPNTESVSYGYSIIAEPRLGVAVAGGGPR